MVDLFCSAGGASKGYHDAGFDVVGVDLADQPNYPFKFIQADAVTFPLDGFDAAAGSPPCQGYSGMSNCRPGLAGEYPMLIEVIRAKFRAQGIPWIIENVEGSGLAAQDDLLGTHGLTLCGTMFGLPLYRHRLFETSFPVSAPPHPRHRIPASKAGHWKPGTIISVEGHCAPIALAREAMGIGWMTRDELAEAIPPAYSEYIGGALLAGALRAAA
jgi:DNA (cytosine-5)-methyltransferase 1